MNILRAWFEKLANSDKIEHKAMADTSNRAIKTQDSPSSSSSPNPSEGLKLIEMCVIFGNRNSTLSITPSQVVVSNTTDSKTILSPSVVSLKAFQPHKMIAKDEMSDTVEPYHKSEKKSKEIDYQMTKRMVTKNEKKVAREKQRESVVPVSGSAFNLAQTMNLSKQQEEDDVTVMEHQMESNSEIILIFEVLENDSLEEIRMELRFVDLEKLKESIRMWWGFAETAGECETYRIFDEWKFKKLWEQKDSSALFKSEILTPLSAAQLKNMMIEISFAKNSRQVFSTNSNGFQLVDLYAAMEPMIAMDSLTIMIVQDGDSLFGAVYQGALHPSATIRSSSLNGFWKIMNGIVENENWSVSNIPFVISKDDSLSFGSSDDSTGIYFQGSLQNGQIGTPGSDDCKEIKVENLEVYTMDI